jgi:hypothetical protein
MRTMQKCTLCDKPSIPGLKPGQGKCQYHWNTGVWGKEWADEVRKSESGDLSPQRPSEAATGIVGRVEG